MSDIIREFAVANEHRYDWRGPVRWIVSHAMRYAYLPILVVGLSVVNNVAYSTIQVFVGRGFDQIVTPGWERRTLWLLAVAIAGAGIAQGVTGLFRNISAEVLAQRVERDARDEFYANLLGKSQIFHGRQRIGDIMARATNDVRMLSLLHSPGVMLIIDAALGAIVPTIVISLIDPRLSLVPIVFLILLVITVYDYNRRLKPVSMAQREQFGVLNAGLTDAIQGIEVVKANVREKFEWSKFASNSRIFRDYFVQQGRIQAFYLPMLAFSVCWGAAFVHSLLVWRSGAITLGQAVAFMGLMSTLRFPTFISLFSFNLVQMGLASARRILELMVTESELDENPAGRAEPIEGRVEFENVSFAYGDNPAITGANFVVEPGETVAIVGQTGSGKTTLTRLINRIFDATNGVVRVDNNDVREWHLDSLRSQISTIEQDVFLYSRTIAENIAFARVHASQAEIEAAAKLAQAHEFIMSFANGYETPVGERGATLSGGQRQRIAIARAFLADPRILILDDSTSAIDSATEDEIQRAMKAISSSRTTFMITHRLSQIRWADSIVVMKKGRITDRGTHDVLFGRSADYRRIFESRPRAEVGK